MASKAKSIAAIAKALEHPPMKLNKKQLAIVEEAKLGNSRRVRRNPGAQLAPFSGVSQLSAAPVSLGNTIRSTKQQVVHTRDGVRVIGRDFVQAVGGQVASFTNWCLQGGFSLSPIGLNASGLRGYFQTYQHYTWNRVNAHYVTSSPTSTSGDILIMYHRNHGGPKVNHTSANFLSYALSTDSALIGPQWTNHSIEIVSKPGSKLMTDVLNAEDVQHQADGEILIYAKNTTNGTASDQPGYILIDYDVSFTDRMLNPRVQTLPSSIFKWTPSGIVQSGAVTAKDIVLMTMGTTNTYSGVNSTPLTGTALGDVYQVVLDLQSATFGGTLNVGSAATMWGVNFAFSGAAGTMDANLSPYPLTTGVTLYALQYDTGSTFAIFPTYPAVFAGNSLRWTATSAGQAFTCPAIFCCVGSTNNVFTQANIG